MNKQKFIEAKNKIKAGYAVDRIIEDTDEKLIVQAENGTYLAYKFMTMPADAPRELLKLMHNKVIFQWTDDLKKRFYKNVSRYIMGIATPPEGKMKETLKELAMRVQIGAELT